MLPAPGLEEGVSITTRSQRTIAILLVVVMLALRLPAKRGRVDIAPPQQTPGGGLEPGEMITQVRIPAERVLIEVRR